MIASIVDVVCADFFIRLYLQNGQRMCNTVQYTYTTPPNNAYYILLQV